jgi:hypothetical protein
MIHGGLGQIFEGGAQLSLRRLTNLREDFRVWTSTCSNHFIHPLIHILVVISRYLVAIFKGGKLLSFFSQPEGVSIPDPVIQRHIGIDLRVSAIKGKKLILY